MQIDDVTGQEIHPDAALILAAMRAQGRPAMETLTPTEARLQMRAMREALRQPKPAMAEVRDLAAEGPHGPVPLRLYRSGAAADEDAAPTLVFFHGGGWVVGDLDTHDVTCRHLADAAGAVVVAVDYRLAPEHKFPAAFDDALAATRFVAGQSRALGLDASRIAVAGDSAGGNLAAVVALAAAQSGPKLSAQVLIYPAVDLALRHDSYARVGTGFTLTSSAMAWFRDHYLRDASQIADWRVSPLRAAELGATPPAFIVTASLDPLCDEGEDYARALERAGVDVSFRCEKGHMHGFAGLSGIAGAADQLVSEIGAFLREIWARPE